MTHGLPETYIRFLEGIEHAQRLSRLIDLCSEHATRVAVWIKFYPYWRCRRVAIVFRIQQRTALAARQCPGELTYGLLMPLVPDLGKIAGDL